MEDSCGGKGLFVRHLTAWQLVLVYLRPCNVAIMKKRPTECHTLKDKYWDRFVRVRCVVVRNGCPFGGAKINLLISSRNISVCITMLQSTFKGQ